MQRHSGACCSHHVTSVPKTHSDLPIREALGKSDEEFFAASVQFLRKKLHEKTCRVDDDSQNTTQSCCCLLDDRLQPKPAEKLGEPLITELDTESPKPVGPSLSMHQVLPFPKSNKYGFFARLKNTFKKYKSYYDVESKIEELENDKSTSNFKFPIRDRASKSHHPSGLVDITEETPKDLKAKTERSSTRRRNNFEGNAEIQINR